MQDADITREVAIKVLEVVDAGLVKGMGMPMPGAMCVEAAVNYAMGLPHGDEPACVALALRSLKICLNDKKWSSNEARAKGLRRLALAQLGSAGHLDEKEFARRVAESVIRKQVPMALRAAAEAQKDAKHRQKLRDAANRCESEGSRDAVDAAADAADAAVNASSAANAAYAASNAAANAAAYAANAAAYAAYVAADAVSNAAAYAAADAAKRDEVLAAFAEDVVQILVAMDAPGCQWLDLAPVAA